MRTAGKAFKRRTAPASTASRVRQALAALERAGTTRYRDGLARYGIYPAKAFGVPMSAIQRLGKQLGRDHSLAVGLWASRWYEARMLAAYVDEPGRVTSAQMDRWCRDFDNWAVCDTVCFVLFDRTPFTWRKIPAWARRDEEFMKRAAFALLASVALHDKAAKDAAFFPGLRLIERATSDERNYVKKGVSWALRVIGRRNRALHTKAVALARRLAASPDAAARWVGKDALKDLTRPLVLDRVAAR